jgi:hypothetical protein
LKRPETFAFLDRAQEQLAALQLPEETLEALLDLEGLYWNLRRFRTGRRRGKTPYEIMGLQLPAGDWWQLLKLTPAQLTQHLSGQWDTS